ncbi:MAG: permease, partial [Deltaproteobacteria bacterium]
RLAITLFLSLGAGVITQFMMNRGWFGQDILRSRKAVPVQSTAALIKNSWKYIKNFLTPTPVFKYSMSSTVSESCTSCSGKTSIANSRLLMIAPSMQAAASSPAACTQVRGCGCDTEPPSFKLRLFKETVKASLMVSKFMALAFFLGAVITLYVPGEWIIRALGQQNPMSIFTAAAFGIPVYTSNLSALPIISGLLTQGMKPAAALAFLIAGPTTTLPAMAAVWPLVSHRVFTVYVSVSLIGAVLAGYLYDLARLLSW